MRQRAPAESSSIAVNGASGEGGEEEGVGEVFAQAEVGEQAGLAVAQGVEQAEGQVGEA